MALRDTYLTYERLQRVTDDEARVLVELFGPDGCYGVASSFMHLIETAPSWPLKECFEHLNNEWKVELRNRAIKRWLPTLGECTLWLASSPS